MGFAVVEGPDWVFTAANDRYLEMVSRIAIVGQKWADVFPELVGTTTHEVVRSVYKGQTVQVSEHLVPLIRNGQHTNSFFSFTLTPLRGADGAVNGFVTIAIEETELVQKRVEVGMLGTKLRESELRYRELLESTKSAPVVQRSSASSPGAIKGELTGITILVVDDESDSLELLRGVLEARGATVETAGSAKDALQRFQAKIPSIVVSDVGMPEEDGLWLIAKVRALSALEGGRTPAIAVTGFVSSDEQDRCMRAGFNHHLGKPFEAHELVRVIRALAR